MKLTQTTKSFTENPNTKAWRLVDADGQVLGRAATEIANLLRGKHRPQYTPHADMGDFVVVINAAKVRVTKSKELDKVYYRHTGWVGGLKERTLRDQRERDARKLLLAAVKGMLPKGPLGYSLLKKLKVYNGPEHPHKAQKALAHAVPKASGPQR